MRRVLLAFEPPDGGVAENVRSLAVGLRDHGWEASVAGPRDSMIYGELEAEGINLTRVPSLMRSYRRPQSDVRSLWSLRKIARDGDFDLVHCHSAKAGVLGRAAARAASVPAVHSPHCFPFAAPYPAPIRQATIAIERAAGRATDMLLCVSREERDQASNHRIVDPARLRVIHNGCPPCDRSIESDTEIERWRDGRPMAATLCVLRRQKGVKTWVDAAPRVLEAAPDSCLAVIGDGDLLPELEAQARANGLDDRFSFFPFRGPPARQLRSLEVFVLSSGWESLPIAVLEAMACAVPQVATDVGGTAEAVLDGETGLLCPPDDPVALADRVSRLLVNPDLRARMRQASLARHAQEFTVDLMVERTASLYDEVLATPGRHREVRPKAGPLPRAG